MAHHGSQPLDDSDIARFFGRPNPDAHLGAEQLLGKLGATGKFPAGKMVQRDEGEIRMAIGQQGGKVVINFGTPTAWIGMTPEQAEDLANTIREHAIEARLRR